MDAPSSQQLWELGERVRAEVPVLHQRVHDSPLVYLDSAATSQKPRVVLDAMTSYYEQINSNVHRGVHYLSARATDEYEAARHKVARFINAKSDREIVFTRNASEAINLVAYSWAMQNLQAGDEVRCAAAALGGGARWRRGSAVAANRCAYALAVPCALAAACMRQHHTSRPAMFSRMVGAPRTLRPTRACSLRTHAPADYPVGGGAPQQPGALAAGGGADGRGAQAHRADGAAGAGH